MPAALDAEPCDGSHQGKVSSTDLVSNDGRPDGEASGHSDARCDDPRPGDKVPQCDPLRDTDHSAGNEAAREGCADGVNRTDDQVAA